jgi:hypothetical protein
LFIGTLSFAQTHVEYISEPADSMALINKADIDIINSVFNERNKLDSLCKVNEKLIAAMEINNRVQYSVMESQDLMIKNQKKIINELETRNENSVQYYSKELKKEKTKKISFQTTTGLSIIAIILILLL